MADVDVPLRIVAILGGWGLTRRLGEMGLRVDGVLHRALGIPLFLFMMYLMFRFTISIGGAFIDFFNQTARVLLVDGFSELLSALGVPNALRVVLAGGLGGACRRWRPSYP